MAALTYSTAQWCRQFNEHAGGERYSGRVSALGGKVEARSVTWEDLSRFQSAGGVSCWGDKITDCTFAVRGEDGADTNCMVIGAPNLDDATYKRALGDMAIVAPISAVDTTTLSSRTVDAILEDGTMSNMLRSAGATDVPDNLNGEGAGIVSNRVVVIPVDDDGRADCVVKMYTYNEEDNVVAFVSGNDACGPQRVKRGDNTLYLPQCSADGSIEDCLLKIVSKKKETEEEKKMQDVVTGVRGMGKAGNRLNILLVGREVPKKRFPAASYTKGLVIGFPEEDDEEDDGSMFADGDGWTEDDSTMLSVGHMTRGGTAATFDFTTRPVYRSVDLGRVHRGDVQGPTSVAIKGFTPTAHVKRLIIVSYLTWPRNRTGDARAGRGRAGRAREDQGRRGHGMGRVDSQARDSGRHGHRCHDERPSTGTPLLRQTWIRGLLPQMSRSCVHSVLFIFVLQSCNVTCQWRQNRCDLQSNSPALEVP